MLHYSADWGQPKVIKLTVGTKYNIWSEVISRNGQIYTPQYIQTKPASITPKEDTSNAIDVNFTKKDDTTLINAKIEIENSSDLPKDFTTIIRLTGEKGKTYDYPAVGAQGQDIQVQPDVYTLSASKYNLRGRKCY